MGNLLSTAESFSVDQLINGDGLFNENIEQHLNLATESGEIGTVSVIGVQGYGKSTLLNQCYSTNFQAGNPGMAPQLVTRGVWISKCTSTASQKILVIDTEGTDSLERLEEGDLQFERKVTYFALAMSNVVIFNMKFNNINNRRDGSWMLLQTLFEVLIRKFEGQTRSHFMVVIRDKDESCQFDELAQKVQLTIFEIWYGISGTEGRRKPTDCLTIKVVAMSHFTFRRKQFDKEVVNLKRLISKLVQNRESRRKTASTYLNLAEETWDVIKEYGVLNTKANQEPCHTIYQGVKGIKRV